MELDKLIVRCGYAVLCGAALGVVAAAGPVGLVVAVPAWAAWLIAWRSGAA